MTKELEYFRIGESCGGNQDWFRDHWMHIGGCAAAAACDTCIQLEMTHIKPGLFPYNIHELNKEMYIEFAMKMKPYLRPRWSGIDRLEIYIDGMERYLKDIHNDTLKLQGMSSDLPVDIAKETVKDQINKGFPIPYLLLRHKNPALHDFLWHWFMVVGYKESEEGFCVKVATYGESAYISFNDLWQSGYKKNGGMIVYK